MPDEMPDPNEAQNLDVSEQGAQAYFVRESATRFGATQLLSGAWNTEEQHIAPTIGLLAHLLETDFAARRQDDLRLTRVSYDILGTMPLEPMDVTVSVLRPGRTIELVEARLSQRGRDAVIARGWFTARYDTAALQGSPFPPMRPVEEMERWGLHTNWAGDFVRTPQIWRHELEVGRVQFWLRGDVPLLANERVSPLAHMLRLIDVSNGVAARVAPGEVAFPNLDLTVHVFREPVDDLTGLDTTASFGPDGAGLTHTVLHDREGPFGTFAQTLTVRPLTN